MTHSNECSIWESQPAGDDGWHDCTCHVFYSNESSIHDPLCPHSDDWENVCDGYFCDDPGGACRHDFCQCDIITKVREDCLEKVEGAYIVGSDGKALSPSHPEYSHDGTETWNAAVKLAVQYLTGVVD